MKNGFFAIKFVIFIFYTFSDTKQDTISTIKIGNLGSQKLSVGGGYKIVEFDCTPYFEDDNRNVYILFTNRYNVRATLYIFYDKSKINIDNKNKRVVDGYDTDKSLLNVEKLYFSLKQNIAYFAFVDFYNDIDTFTVHFFSMESYYNISNLTNYYFYFPQSNFHFTTWIPISA